MSINKNLSSMTPDQKKSTLQNMRNSLEETFVELGQLLHEVQVNNLHGFFGYPTFKEFIEDEFNMSGSLATKLINNYKFYLEKMGLDEPAFVSIGIEKLNQLRPILNKVDRLEQENWLKKAEEEKSTVLKEKIKDHKEKNKTKNVKDVFTDQFVEKMVTYFNCTRKELMFKLALFFQGQDLEQVGEQIRSMQEKLKQEELNRE